MKRLWNQVVTMVQPASATLVAIVLMAILFGYRAGSLVKGTTSQERAQSASSLQIRTIIDNPVNAPYKIVQYSAGKIHRSITVQRLVSGLAAGLMIMLFYTIASRLFKRYAAISGTVLFASSSALLHIGRSGTADIMLLSLFALVVCGYAAKFNPKNNFWFVMLCISVALGFYVPGMIFFIAAGLLWQLKSIQKSLRSLRTPLIVLCISFLLLSLIPIILSLVNNPLLWRSYLGLPEVTPPVLDMVKTAVYIPLSIFAYAPANPHYRLGHVPILDAFSAGMFIIGAYTLLTKHVLDRTRMLIGILLLCMLWSGVSATFSNSIVLLPFIYLVVCAGITWFIHEWLVVFPRNPLARLIAYTLLAVGIFLSSNFQLQRYFLAWPNAPETKAIYKQE